MPGRLDPRLRERHYGAFQSLTFAEAKASLPEDYARYVARDPEFDFGGGESLRDFSARALGCLAGGKFAYRAASSASNVAFDSGYSFQSL